MNVRASEEWTYCVCFSELSTTRQSVMVSGHVVNP